MFHLCSARPAIYCGPYFVCQLIITWEEIKSSAYKLIQSKAAAHFVTRRDRAVGCRNSSARKHPETPLEVNK
jgi:hypothetical protein